MMTPLAHRIIKESLLPMKRRSFVDDNGMLNRMRDIHCFEVSDAFELLDDIARRLWDASIPGGWTDRLMVDETTAFAPARNSFIEWVEPDGLRTGVLLEESNDKTWSMAHVCVYCRDYFYSIEMPLIVPLSGAIDTFPMVPDSGYFGENRDMGFLTIFRIYAALAIINSPRIIGRRQHMPHRGLERSLIRAQKSLGEFPLNAWTEIKLSINSMADITNDPPVEAHLTGKKALHFCRSHIRIRLGRLEIVRAHWRGDAALGIKQSRYKVTQ